MFSSQEDGASAILFFSTEGVVKELLYSEFEAMLEGFTPEADWAGKDAKAVYLELAPDLSLKAAVFFNIAFDNEGWVEASWNIPLVNLARVGKPLPGAGNLRVVTAAECSDAEYQGMLWTPDLAPTSKVLGWIRETIAVNRLGLSKKVSEDTGEMPAVDPATLGAGAMAGMGGVMEAQLAQLLQSQMTGASGVANTMAELESTKKEYEQKLNALTSQLAEKVHQYEGIREQVDKLEEKLEGKDRRLAELKEFYELKLEKTKGDESDYIKALRDHYEKEANEMVASAESEFKELLNWREVELMYRAERESQLHEEIAKLRLQNAELQQTDSDNLLERLSAKGISFMTYQVGLGHISIPVDDVPLYLANPIGFVAAYCNVTQAVYLDWLAHFHAPVCRAIDENGDPCGADITKIESPENYMPGISDCCEKHRHSA